MSPPQKAICSGLCLRMTFQFLRQPILTPGSAPYCLSPRLPFRPPSATQFPTRDGGSLPTQHYPLKHEPLLASD